MKKLLASFAFSFAALLFPSPSLVAQQAKPTARIVGPIDNNGLVALKGNVNPHANVRNDRGPVAQSLSLPDLTLVLSRSPEQQAAFDAYVQSEYNPGSPNYHHWLTPTEIGTEFGPAPADIAAITNWLGSQGFTVTRISPDHMTIRFSGTAGQAETAFHTSIHNLSVKGVPHFANMTNPKIPAALAPVVVGIKSLDNFLPHPLHRLGGKVSFDPDRGHWMPEPATASGQAPSSVSQFHLASPAAAARAASQASPHPHPLFGINVPATSGSAAYLEEDVTPWDFATIYNVAPLWSDNITGTGQTIAIVGTSDINQTDVSTFRSTFGLPALASFREIDTNGLATTCTSTSPNAICNIGDLEENTSDVEWSGATAPGAAIVLVVTGQNAAGTVDSVFDSAQYAVENETAKIVSVSYGECELGQGTTENVAYYNLWEAAAAEGISVFVATGDSGSPSCDDGGDEIGNPYSALYGISVNGMSSTPFDVAVGGTDFSWCKPVYNSSGTITGCPASSSSQGSPAYWASSNQSSSSQEPYESALGYVPEIPWNDTCENPIVANLLESIVPLVGLGGSVSNPEAACNWVQNNWEEVYNEDGVMLASYVDTVGGGGGPSNCVSNDTDTDENNPTCNSSATSVSAGSSSIPLTNDGWRKPAWQTGVTGIPGDGVRDSPDVSFFAGDGLLNSAYLVCISELGACTYSATSENTAQEIGGTSLGVRAMAGVMALIDQKAGSPQGLAAPGLYQLAREQNYANCSAENSSTGTCYFHSIDEGTNSMPCDLGATIGGAIFESGNWQPGEVYPGVDSPNCKALNSGDQVGTLVSPDAVTSTNTNGVAYDAATGYNMATGLGSMNVANVVNSWSSDTGTASAVIGVTLTPSSGSVSGTTPLVVAVTVTPAAPSSSTPTGTVTVAGGGYSSNGTLSGGAVTLTIPAGSLAPGTDTLTISYSGDQTYAAASTTETVSVAAATPTVQITAPATGNLSNSITVIITVNPPEGGPAPTGTVTLSGGSYSSTAVALSSTNTASFTIPPGALPVGTDTLTASYSGSSTYTSATASTTITMVNTTLMTPAVHVTPTPTSISTSQVLTVTVSVSGSGPVPTGIVGLTSSSSTVSGASWIGNLDGNGTATITIPAGSLNAGTDTLTASFGGDASYSAATGTATVTVTASSYSFSATTPSAIQPGGTASSTITGNPSSSDYTGKVTLNACSLTSSSVSNPVSAPTCSVSGTITYTSGTASGSGTATVSTTPDESLLRPGFPRGSLFGAGGAALCLMIFFGIPAKRKSWRALLGLFVLLVTLGSMVACGGTGGANTSTATSSGTYTFTVNGSGSDAAATTSTTTFTVTVN